MGIELSKAQKCDFNFLCPYVKGQSLEHRTGGIGRQVVRHPLILTSVPELLPLAKYQNISARVRDRYVLRMDKPGFFQNEAKLTFSLSEGRSKLNASDLLKLGKCHTVQ